ncbi:unnamed protein product [Ambrosiozyma monospora]|uniref:Unnamed protein product n=1 Tax=Ambrosiozyma monospora TaxID=43982 RepID=A0A9W6T937_AMBMO|nr:unnamed protein product [Ambrosiozyma monospora]
MYKHDNENLKMKILLVGNKLDLLKKSDDDDDTNSGSPSFKECSFIDNVERFINENQDITRFFQTSAKLNIGLSDLFSHIIDDVDESLFMEEETVKTKKDLIDLRSVPGSMGNSSCQC